MTPYKTLFGAPPHYNHLKVFGCLCSAHNHGKPRDKFDARANRCVFLGYPQGKKGWLLYNLDNHKLIISRDVQFYEKVFLFAQNLNKEELHKIQYHDLTWSDETLLSSTRLRTPLTPQADQNDKSHNLNVESGSEQTAQMKQQVMEEAPDTSTGAERTCSNVERRAMWACFGHQGDSTQSAQQDANTGSPDALISSTRP